MSDAMVRNMAGIARYKLSIYDEYDCGPWLQETRADVTAEPKVSSEDTEWCKSQDVAALIDALTSLKRGDCWCEKGIGNPMFSDHSAKCVRVRDLLGAL